jgi:serine/threonine protein kinase
MKADYETTFESLELDEKTLKMGHGETITPTISRATRSTPAMETLPPFQVDALAGSLADYRIVGPLGEGGMGVVSLAEQTALRRLVAVKEPKPGDQSAYGRVLDEAFIMARMEHPNVVPAYSLGRHQDGQPILVMKRVEGTSWEHVITGAAEVPGGGKADLAWHLRVLLQICNALRFAHARKVVHRDIKPENVMIGEFGEVYLLDWGVALSTDPDAGEGIPTVHTSKGVAGTPAFMAPEMTIDDPTEVDERTDVYLLGANLHALLTGSPPHDGRSLLEVFMKAYQSVPQEYDEHVASELVEIMHKAMSREKKDRYQTVGAFAAAVASYLEHRASFSLSDAASEVLEKAIGAGEGTNNLLLEAEFGFRHALTIWDDNEAAKRGLQSTLEARIRWFLAHDEAVGARAAFNQLFWPNDELQAMIESLEVELKDRAERVDYLEAFENNLDLRTGTRARQRAVILMGIAFTLLSLSQVWTTRPGQPETPPAELLQVFWKISAIALIGVGLFWKKLVSNLANKRLVAFFMSALGGILLLRFAGVYLNPPVLYIQVAETLVVGLTAFGMGTATSARLAVTGTLSYGISAVITAITGEMWVAMLSLGLAHICFFGTMAWLWRPSRTRLSA